MAITTYSNVIKISKEPIKPRESTKKYDTKYWNRMTAIHLPAQQILKAEHVDSTSPNTSLLQDMIVYILLGTLMQLSLELRTMFHMVIGKHNAPKINIQGLELDHNATLICIKI